jgi:hypothetical protein
VHKLDVELVVIVDELVDDDTDEVVTAPATVEDEEV